MEGQKQNSSERKEAGDDMAYAQAVAHLAEINEGAVVAKAEEILYGLGFQPNDSSRQVSEVFWRLGTESRWLVRSCVGRFASVG